LTRQPQLPADQVWPIATACQFFDVGVQRAACNPNGRYRHVEIEKASQRQPVHGVGIDAAANRWTADRSKADLEPPSGDIQTLADLDLNGPHHQRAGLECLATCTGVPVERVELETVARASQFAQR
jgi:hypothetical protein